MTKSTYTFQMPLGALLLTVTATDVTQSDDIVWYTPKPTLVRVDVYEGERRIHQEVVGMGRPWGASTAGEAAGYVVQHMWAKAQIEEVQ